MSAYLQRMAMGAAKPAGNIRPVLDPVFSGLTPRAVADASLQEESVRNANDPISTPRSESVTHPDLSGAPGRVPSSSVPHLLPEQNPEREATVHPASEIRELQPPVRVAEGANAVKGNSAATKPDSPHFLVALQETMGEGDARPVGNRDTESLGSENGVGAPRLREAADRSESASRVFTPVVQEKSPAGESHPGQMPRSADPRKGAGAAAREPDEINIHIGRIEVTAVQPAAPNTSGPRTRRSGSSLDDYLRQRDRRSS